MLRTTLATLIVATLTACGGGGSEAPAAQPAAVDPPPVYEVVIMAGQSNILGADAAVDPTDPTRNLVDAGMQTAADRAGPRVHRGGHRPADGGARFVVVARR